MSFTPQEAKQLHKKLMEDVYEMELFAARNKIDNLLKNTPGGTSIDSMKRVLDVLSKEYEALGWSCRQYTKSYFSMDLNYLEISALPYRSSSWKEKVLNFLSKL